ncbi:MAG: T9SS type B sorting domain-containing protein [Flavobacterium sp.]|nr:T9SS type B sorting domain-containing protein [Flavobacterium sp.]
MKKISFFIFFLILKSQCFFSQYIQVDDTYTAQQLIENVFASSGCANVSNFSVNGENISGNLSYGFFQRGTSSFPFDNGILLSTGKAISAIGPNTTTILSEGSNSWAGDSDLEAALGISNSINATVLEFDFIPLTSKISFDYIFASEQYLTNPSASQCGFTDGFAFLLKAIGSPTYTNIALVPGTTTPVSVNTIRGSGTVCPAANEICFDAFNPFEYPTSYNGQTKILKAQSDVIIGQPYHIKLVIADQGNNLYDSGIFLGGGSFQSETYLGNDRTVALDNPYCSGENVVLNALQPGTNTYKWFKDGIDTGITTPTYTVTDNTNPNEVEYTVEVTINGSCISKGEITLQFVALPIVTSLNISQCDLDTDGQTIFNLTELETSIKNNDPTIETVTFSETLGGAAITNTSSYTSSNTTIYVEAENRFKCKNTASITLSISTSTVQTATISKCDTDTKIDGFTAFDLPLEVDPTLILLFPGTTSVSYYSSAANAITQTSPLQPTYTNFTIDSAIIYARLSNGFNCNGIVAVTLNVNHIDLEDLKDETKFLCSGQTLILSVNPSYALYDWSNEIGTGTFETTISNPGIYTVEMTDSNNCKGTKKITVLGSAPASNIDADINEFSDNNSILITYQDNGGNYEFSIDNQNYQDSPFFSNLSAGTYTISVRDKNDCLPSPSKVVYILDYPKFFTPNGDGIHDFWTIKNLDKRQKSEIFIFNRFGKLLKQLDSNSNGWDGKYANQNLPADDYWFILTYFNGKSVKSHFTLKR